MKNLIFVLVIAAICFSQNILISQASENVSNGPDLTALVEVKKVDMDFAGKDENEISMMLWNKYANKPYEMQFSNVTTKDWLTKFEHYKADLINKATQQGFNSTSLEKCLVIKEQGVAILPVGAYLAKSGQDDVWIIVWKWEFASKDKAMLLGHISITAFRANDQVVIGYVSCR